MKLNENRIILCAKAEDSSACIFEECPMYENCLKEGNIK